jgi:DNA-binding NarL/FixJ family response regulator
MLRVVLVGPADERARLRLALGNTSIEIAGEALTVEEARGRAAAIDAYLVAAEDRRRPHLKGEELTPRELDVLRLLAEGLANKTIAVRLGISDQTVKFHVASIVGKLGAANRTAAVRLAIRKGLVEI